jgi:tetratricopeptide (TPR) repeat protein
MVRRWIVGLGFAASLAISGQALANDSYGYRPPEAAGDATQMKNVRAAIDAKNWRGAISILNGLAASDPKNADVENLLGFSYRMLGQYPDAFHYYDLALTLDPGHKGALEYEGEAYLETNQLPKAMANLSTLRTACGSQGCPEIALLSDAIGRYKARAKIN